MGRFFTSVGAKERKKAGAAGAGRRPERSWEGLRRIRRTSCTFVQLRRRGCGAEYEFITQDHATSIQMKLAWRAYLERNISRSPDFICLDMSSAHRKTPRLAWLSWKSAAPRLAAPRRAGTHRTHSTNAQLKSIAFALTLVAHAETQCGSARALDRRARVEARARNSLFIMCAAKAGKPSEFRARSRQKAPTPCTNEAFTSRARQGGFLVRRERESHV